MPPSLALPGSGPIRCTVCAFHVVTATGAYNDIEHGALMIRTQEATWLLRNTNSRQWPMQIRSAHVLPSSNAKIAIPSAAPKAKRAVENSTTR